MKTKAAYYDFPFGKIPAGFTANIIEKRVVKERSALILDKTIFYPEGGGQPADRGTINILADSSLNRIPVLDVREEDGTILHFIDSSPESIPPAGEVTLEPDAIRRRDITVQHSAQHLLSGTIMHLAGFPTVSMHLGEEHNTIDINGQSLDSETLLNIEDVIAKAIEEDLPFIIHLCPPENIEDFPLRKIPPQDVGQIRVVEIEKLDYSPCCGTHVSSTGQIGVLRILGTEKYKGIIRMTFIAGRRCLEESRMLRKNAVYISQILKIPIEETGKATAALLEKTTRLEEKLKMFEEEEAHRAAESLLARAFSGSGPAKGSTFYAESFPDKEMEELLRIGKHVQKMTGAIITLGSEKDLKFAAICSAKDADIRAPFKTAVEKAGGKGGGGPSFFQGQFDSPEKYRAFFEELKKLQDLP